MDQERPVTFDKQDLLVGSRAKKQFWELYKSDRSFKDFNPHKDETNDPRFAYFQMCKENNIQPKAGLLIKDSENPSIDFTNQFLKSGPAVKAVAEAVKRYVFPVLAVVFKNNGLQPTQSITIMKSFEHMSGSLVILNFSKNNLGA